MRANGVAGTLLHRRRLAAREIRRLVRDRAAHAAQSALSLDASRAEALLRHRRADQSRQRRRTSGSRPTRSCDGMRVHDILAANKVAVICTTDDPADSLDTHERDLARPGSRRASTRPSVPTRRSPSTSPPRSIAWVEKLAGAAGSGAIKSFDDFLAALKKRHDDFHAVGGRLSDHGMETAFAEPCTAAEAKAIFDAARNGRAATPDELAQFGSFLMLEFGRWDADARLDEAAPPRRAAQQQHPPAATARARHRLRFHRRFPAGPRARRATSTRSIRPTSCRAPSSTT